MDEEKEIELIRVCTEIDEVSECNCHFTAGLPALIKKTGKALADLKVSELLAVIRKRVEGFNNTDPRNQTDEQC